MKKILIFFILSLLHSLSAQASSDNGKLCKKRKREISSLEQAAGQAQKKRKTLKRKQVCRECHICTYSEIRGQKHNYRKRELIKCSKCPHIYCAFCISDFEKNSRELMGDNGCVWCTDVCCCKIENEEGCFKKHRHCSVYKNKLRREKKPTGDLCEPKTRTPRRKREPKPEPKREPCFIHIPTALVQQILSGISSEPSSDTQTSPSNEVEEANIEHGTLACEEEEMDNEIPAFPIPEFILDQDPTDLILLEEPTFPTLNFWVEPFIANRMEFPAITDNAWQNFFRF